MKIYLRTISRAFLACAVCAFAAGPLLARADAVALTITPPFFEVNMAPGDVWQSYIKVVNTNRADLTVYAARDGFAPSDEEGHGKFIPLASLAGDGDALANWISVSSSSLTIPAGGSAEIPFKVAVPQDAAPGGHYAAILVGTAGNSPSEPGATVSVGSFISSLIFVRIKGDVVEQGAISEFSTDKQFYNAPDANFTVKFANTGNVHVRPEGYIEIYNAWGKERGRIDVNQGTNLGYVLPGSERKFDFEWRGEDSLFDIGRYKAIVTLAYGEDGRQSATRTLYFWIIPFWRVLFVLLGSAFFLFVIILSIKLYVRRALSSEMEKYGASSSRAEGKRAAREFTAFKAFAAPVTEGVVDLRVAIRGAEEIKKVKNTPEERRTPSPYLAFIKKHTLFLILFPLFVFGLLWIATYIRQTLTTERTFEMRATVPGKAAPWMQGISGENTE